MLFNIRLRKAVICTVFLLFPAIPAYASVIAIELSNATPTVGDQITASLTVSDVSDLYSFNLDLSYDTSMLSVDSVQPGAFLASAGVTLGDVGLFGHDVSIAGEIQNVNDGLLGSPTGVTGHRCVQCQHTRIKYD